MIFIRALSFLVRTLKNKQKNKLFLNICVENCVFGFLREYRKRFGAHSGDIRGPLGAVSGSTGALLGPSGAV